MKNLPVAVGDQCGGALVGFDLVEQRVRSASIQSGWKRFSLSRLARVAEVQDEDVAVALEIGHEPE